MTQDELRRAVSVNLTHLRRAAGMTQAGLAERINYTDKAVSKWERGESVPDVAVLKTLADLFGVTVDYLITEKHGEDAYYPLAELKRKRVNRALIIGMGVLGVWFLAVVAFMGIDFFNPSLFWAWLVFIYAVPVSLVVWLVLNSVWFRCSISLRACPGPSRGSMRARAATDGTSCRTSAPRRESVCRRWCRQAPASRVLCRKSARAPQP